MLRTEQILNAKFTPISKGTYSADEVDAFLKTVAESYEGLIGEKNELIKKISILADKVESYRNDEEAIKLSLLDAHRMAETVNKNAKEKADSLVEDAEGKSKIILDGANRQSAQIVTEARDKAKEIVDNARTAVTSLTERAQRETEQTISAAKAKADEIVADAEAEGKRIIGSSKKSYEFYSVKSGLFWGFIAAAVLGFANLFAIIQPALSGNISSSIWLASGPVIFGFIGWILYSRYKRKMSNSK